MTKAHMSASGSEGSDLLRLQSVSSGYGDTVVIEEIDLTIRDGESLSIIGRNGVGKTSLLATIMGHTNLHGGQITLAGQPIHAIPVYRRNWAGIGYVPQEREIFPSLSVDENLAVAQRPGHWNASGVLELFPGLAQRRGNLGNQLSGGEQQMLAIGRALVSNPRLLLMDEPSEGLAPVIVEQLQSAITRLRDEFSITTVLVEQNSSIALAFADRCIVMNRGRIIRDGPSAELRENPELLESLVGIDAG